jgi:hypothetical protein
VAALKPYIEKYPKDFLTPSEMLDNNRAEYAFDHI